MKVYRIACIFLALLIIGQSAKASDIKFKITGKLIENETAIPIPYVTVTINNKEDDSIVTGTITDESGNFTLEKITQGAYYMKFSFLGYKEYIIENIEFNEKSGIIDLGILKLQPDTNTLNEVEITAKIPPISKSIDKQVINVEKNISSIGGTAAEALTLSPSAQMDADGNIKLRGSANYKVLINGKPTTLDPSQVLKQTPANQISRIEVITNPSVKYSAEGGAGIINIILKKGIESGFNGIVNASIGTKSKYASDANFNLNKEKTSYSLSFDWRDYTKTAFNNYYRELYNETNTHYASMYQDREITNADLGFRFGLAHDFNEQSNLSYSFHTGYASTIGDILVKTSGYTIPESDEEHMYNTFYFDQKPTFFTNNIGYTRSFDDKGSSLSINAYYSYIDYYLFNGQVLSRTDENHNIIDDEPYLLDITNDNNSNDFRLDADYTKVVSEKSNIEAGLSFHLYDRFLDITYAQFNYDQNDWVNNPLYTNKYNFDEDIYAGYFNLNTSFYGIKTSIGLRVEYMDRLLKRQEGQEKYEFDKLYFFPGFSFSKELSESQSLSLAMTNRTNRPDEYMMNPFPEFEDDYFYAEGNPFLIPEVVRNLELGYQFSKKKTTLSANLYYRITQDKLEQMLTIGDDDKIHTKFHNDNKDQSIGTELMGNFSVTDWWSVNANANLYHYKITSTIEEVETTRKDFSWSTQLVNSFNLGKTTSLQLIGLYNSKTVRSQGQLSDYYFLDVAVKQQFMNGNLTVALQLKDILQSLNYELYTETGNMNLLGDFNNESPIFFINVSYNLSNYKKKTKDVETEFDM